MLFIRLLTTILLTFFITTTKGQNAQQLKWLEKRAAKKDLNSSSPSVKLKSTVIELDGYEIDHGSDVAAGGTLSPSGVGVMTTHNITAASLINSSNVRIPSMPSFPVLRGKGVSILLFDSGRPRVNHDAFEERVIVPRQDLIESNPLNCAITLLPDTFPMRKLHPSIVAGTLISSSMNDARGLAPEAQVIAYDWDYTIANITANALEGANIACIPYGYAAGWAKIENWHWFGRDGDSESYLFGYYSKISKEWDDIAWNAPYLLIVKSAGNEYRPEETIQPNGSYRVCTKDTCKKLCDWDSKVFSGTPYQNGNKGYDCLSDFAVSKNLLVIGAVDNNGNIAKHSGRGPTDDFRIKPDLVSKGTNLFSTINSGPQDYNYSDIGTSYAVGSIAGGAALLLQEQKELYGQVRFLSSTLKGILIHTAKDLGTPGPDYLYGWGIPDISKSAALIDANFNNHRHIHEFTFTGNDQAVIFNVKKQDIKIPLKVTICWTDPSGTPAQVSLNPANPMLVNDIDLRICRTKDNIPYLPWKLNPSDPMGKAINQDNSVDNVEQIIVNEFDTENYTIKICPKEGKLSQNQVVSVIISGNNPLTPQADIIVSNLSISDFKAFEATNTIDCQNVEIAETGKLQLLSGNNIILGQGFKVKSGGYFRASKDVNFYSQFEFSKVFKHTFPWKNLDDESAQSPSVENYDMISSLDNQVSGKFAEAYPNPCNDEFTIRLNSPDNTFSFEIFNIHGHLVYTKKGNMNACESVSLTSLPDGIYFIKIQCNNKIYVLKQMKKSLKN